MTLIHDRKYHIEHRIHEQTRGDPERFWNTPVSGWCAAVMIAFLLALVLLACLFPGVTAR